MLFIDVANRCTHIWLKEKREERGRLETLGNSKSKEKKCLVD